MLLKHGALFKLSNIHALSCLGFRLIFNQMHNPVVLKNFIPAPFPQAFNSCLFFRCIFVQFFKWLTDSSDASIMSNLWRNMLTCDFTVLSQMWHITFIFDYFDIRQSCLSHNDRPTPKVQTDVNSIHSNWKKWITRNHLCLCTQPPPPRPLHSFGFRLLSCLGW